MGGGAEAELLFLRDVNDVEPPRDRYRHYEEEDIYRLVPKPLWTGMEEELWSPRANEHDPQLEKMKQMIKRNTMESSIGGSSIGGGEMSHGVDGVDGSAAYANGSVAEATKLASKLVSRKKKTNNRLRVTNFLNHKVIEAFFIVLTVWSLFMEDVRVLVVPRETDVTIYWCHLVVMIFFCIEVVLRAYAQPNSYFGSFYFYLGILASASMVFDILPLFNPTDEQSMDFNYARLGKSARVGTRLTRLIRILRVLRVLKLFLAKKQKKENEKVEDYKPSELGKELQERISRKVILFTLSLLGGTVMFDLFIPTALDERAFIAAKQVYSAINNETALDFDAEPYKSVRLQFRRIFYDESFNIGSYFFTQNYLDVLRLNLYNRTADGSNITYYIPTKGQLSDPRFVWPNPDFLGGAFGNCTAGTREEDCPENIGPLRAGTELRMTPFCVGTCDDIVNDPAVGDVWYSRRRLQEVEAYFSILLTMSVAALLGIMGYLFSRDADSMVIRPIESMVDSVTKLAANPAHKLEKITKVRYETDALKMSLAKIAAMLQVGFGEAGNNLVAENLKRGDTVDPMVPGKKLLGVYGFCIIDDYEEVLECLGEEILPFTNTAATIVHDAVTDNGGQPNRNLGEAFLCVWKPVFREPNVDETNCSPSELAIAEQQMCDGALTSFRRCVRQISLSSELQSYNSHEEIVKFFDGQYSTVIGYGLHFGWAIEGAVGTNIKIDCSYLSPNVNLSARLESATKMYGVTILMSEFFASRLSPEVKLGLRRVDVVCLKGSSIPMAIYTDDRSNGLYCTTAAIEQFSADKVVEEFQRTFELGMDNFVAGMWGKAKGYFEQALWICPRDKPCKRLLRHMDTPANQPEFGLASQPFVAPEGWAGYHVLLSK